jgi:hypothetical protein
MKGMNLTLFPTLQAPHEVQRRLAPIADAMDPDCRTDVESVVANLVATSVAHGASRPIEMHLEVVDGEVRGVVDDHGPGTRALARARNGEDDTLVLRRIDGLVDDWGTDSAETRVWFRIGLRAAA